MLCAGQLHVGIAHALVDRDTVATNVHRLERRLVGEDRLPFIGTPRVVADHAGAGGVDERFTTAAQGVDEDLDAGKVVRVGGVHQKSCVQDSRDSTLRNKSFVVMLFKYFWL